MKWTTGLFEKLPEWVYRFGFPKGDKLLPFRGYPPFAKAASALGSLPSVALSSAAVKAFTLYHIYYFYERKKYNLISCWGLI